MLQLLEDWLSLCFVMLARLRVASRVALHNVRHITAGDAVRMQRRREGERLREAIGTQVSTTKPELSFAPKKMVLLARQIRRLSVPEAIVQMQFSKKRASYAVSKVIQVSARQEVEPRASCDALGARAHRMRQTSRIFGMVSPPNSWRCVRDPACVCPESVVLT